MKVMRAAHESDVAVILKPSPIADNTPSQTNAQMLLEQARRHVTCARGMRT